MQPVKPARRLPRSGAVAIVTAGVMASLTLSGCTDYSKLAFHQDHRLTFTAPASRVLVTLPVTVRWTMRDFPVPRPGAGTPRDDRGYFAVFVDRAPFKPGETMRALADDDCK